MVYDPYEYVPISYGAVTFFGGYRLLWTIERVVMRQFFPKPWAGCFFAAFLCTEMAQKI